MNRLDIQRAERLLSTIAAKDADQVFNKLASYFRQTGLISTLRWLETKDKNAGPDIARAIEKELGISRKDLEKSDDNLVHFRAVRKAASLIDALHVTHRARKN